MAHERKKRIKEVAQKVIVYQQDIGDFIENYKAEMIQSRRGRGLTFRFVSVYVSIMTTVYQVENPRII